MSKSSKTLSEIIPCAKCKIRPASIHYAVEVTAFGLGNITIYLCQEDFQLLQQHQQSEHNLLQEYQERQQAYHLFRQEAEKSLLIIYGQTWPEREILHEQHRRTGNLHMEAREAYRITEDNTSDALLARCKVIRLASISLAEAIAIEASNVGSSISGTIFNATMAFHKKGLTLPDKRITQEQLFTATQTILHYRETHPENEEIELALVRDLQTQEASTDPA